MCVAPAALYNRDDSVNDVAILKKMRKMPDVSVEEVSVLRNLVTREFYAYDNVNLSFLFYKYSILNMCVCVCATL